jgi:inward rectifier potassium channel
MAKKTKDLELINNSGYSEIGENKFVRVVNKDGSYNITKTGIGKLTFFSWYHTLLDISRIKLLLVTVLFYVSANIVFGTIYVLVGVDKLDGVEVSDRIIDNFISAYFFSSQTLTTVGYGHISPIGLVTNVIASIESMAGIIAFALVTGIFYARFSKPKAYLRFSDSMLIVPYKNGKALMVRLVSYKNNHLTDAKANLTGRLVSKVNGEIVSKFFQLKLEISEISALSLNWTLVHVIDEESPLFDIDFNAPGEHQLEIILTLTAFDEKYSNTVKQRTSYIMEDIVYGAKFLPMYHYNSESRAILDISKLNEFKHIPI